MLMKLSFVLNKAKAEKRCIPAINVYNLETVQAVLTAAKNLQTPIIVSFGESYLKHASLKQIAAIVRHSAFNHDGPVVLHLDHAKRMDTIKNAIDCGFTSVMYDGSHLPFRQNIEHTRKVVELAGKNNISVEAELGYLNPEDGSSDESIANGYTRVEEAEIFVKETKVDALAVAIGNAHGIYKGTPCLDFQRLCEISNAVDIPLVLHGSSGISEDQLKKAISLGIAKMNVNTEVALAGSEAIKRMLAQQGIVRLERLMENAQAEMVKVIEKYIKFAYFE